MRFLAAVLVWIFGGGYTAGTKSSNGNPAGILARSQDYNGEGVIFVAINYRLGLFVNFPFYFPSIIILPPTETDSVGLVVRNVVPRKRRFHSQRRTLRPAICT
jgi:hypothetical protein